VSIPRAHGRLNNERGTLYRLALIKGHSDARGTRRAALEGRPSRGGGGKESTRSGMFAACALLIALELHQ